jgi:acetyl-CoA synthetase
LRHHRPPAASRPATASWSCWVFAHARRNLAPYQCIRRIEIMELPETISGKIRRVDMRACENACAPEDLTNEYRD